MSIVLYHISINKAQLDAMPANERNFLVLLAHATNEIGILAKLFHYCAKGRPRKQLSKQVMNVQALLMGRLVTGKIYECWVILRGHYFRKPLQKKYDSKLPRAARAGLAKMQSYFEAKNLISRVRNKYAFHYDAHQITEGHRTLNVGEPLDMYLAKSQANTLYAFADLIAGRAMLECIHKGDPAKAFNMLISETSKAIAWINVGTGGLMATLFKEYFGRTLQDLTPTTLKVWTPAASARIRIPYFINVPKPKRKHGRRTANRLSAIREVTPQSR